MLLTLNELDLNARAESFRRALHEITGALIPVTRKTPQSHRVHLCIDGPLEQDPDFVRATTDRGGAEWGMLLWEGSAFLLYVAFEEEWQVVQASNADWRHVLLSAQQAAPRRSIGANSRLVFGGLRIRFYLKRQGAGGFVRQWLRCEWEPYRFEGELSQDSHQLNAENVGSRLAFDASKAAHPHFHFDAIPLTARAQQRLSAGSSSGEPRAFGESQQSFDGAFPGGFVTAQDCDLHHIHLPSSSTWPSATFDAGASPSISTPLPHQHYPTSTAELDNWFGWNVAYFTNQFQTCIGDL